MATSPIQLITKITVTPKDIANSLELDYYKSYGQAISYQTGGCYDLAISISKFLNKHSIQHSFCQLIGYENELKKEDEKCFTHAFIKIEDKYYDSFNFGVTNTDQIFYQFEDVETFHKEIEEEEMDFGSEDCFFEKDFLQNMEELKKISFEDLSLEFAIQNNKTTDWERHLHEIYHFQSFKSLSKGEQTETMKYNLGNILTELYETNTVFEDIKLLEKANR